MKICRYEKEQVEELIKDSPEGKNTKFLNSAHSLWYRFKNYEKQKPFVLEDNGPVALVFATLSQRSKYINLYEIVTCEGKEGKGYATEIWENVMKRSFDSGMQRLKISCTPSSITWHKRNGLVFWAVDPSGSLRSDQPLFPNKHEQCTWREKVVNSPEDALPTDTKVLERLKSEGLESHKFGPKKTATVQKAIEDVGPYWLRETLFNTNTLESFFG